VRLGILVSGRGSNLEAILRARPRGIDPVLVISNRAAVRALEVAATHGVPARVFRRADFGGDASARDAAIGQALTEAGADLAILAGYDRLLSPSYFAAFGGRTINIHPSLLPAHGGVGMLGLAVHRAVLEAGDPETGATVHEVGAELDAGPVLSQVRVPVRPDDDAETLAARVLEAEHALLVSTLERLASSP
jgi:phosphoribosylglycinamide formyltransferase-1